MASASDDAEERSRLEALPLELLERCGLWCDPMAFCALDSCGTLLRRAVGPMVQAQARAVFGALQPPSKGGACWGDVAAREGRRAALDAIAHVIRGAEPTAECGNIVARAREIHRRRGWEVELKWRGRDVARAVARDEAERGDLDFVAGWLEVIQARPIEILRSAILEAIEALPHGTREEDYARDRYLHVIEAATGARISLLEPTAADLRSALEAVVATE